MKHLFYTGGWKKFENLWAFIINSGALRIMLPFLELLLSEIEPEGYRENLVNIQNKKESQLDVA